MPAPFGRVDTGALRVARAGRAAPGLRWAMVLLALHAGLAMWAATRNSVTFDENFHLPAGVLAVTQGDLWVSFLNPPLLKMACALPALAAGARVPAVPDSLRRQDIVGEAFMRANADRYHRVFLAARHGRAALGGARGGWCGAGRAGSMAHGRACWRSGST